MIGTTALAAEFWENGRSATCPIIDMHGHMDSFAAIYFPRGTADQMVGTMDECGVQKLVFTHHHALLSPDLGNQPSLAPVRKYPARLRAYCLINPNYPELAERELQQADENRDVFIGIKFLSDYHRMPVTDDRYRPALEYAGSRGLPCLMHTWGGSPFDGEGQVRQLAERYPDQTFLLGHSCHGSWDAAVRLAHDFPHIYLETTALYDDRGILEKFCAEVGSQRLLFGTDLPWFDPHQAVGALFSAHLSDEEIHDICHRNAERLLAPLW